MSKADSDRLEGHVLLPNTLLLLLLLILCRYSFIIIFIFTTLKLVNSEIQRNLKFVITFGDPRSDFVLTELFQNVYTSGIEGEIFFCTSIEQFILMIRF